MIKYVGLLTFLFVTINAEAQSLKHQPTWCHGEVPKEFLEGTDDIFAEVDDASENTAFEINARISIKEMLESGIILFGDSISNYINTLGHEILRRNKIQDNIRFYVLRSPIFNAYSFDQGSIFVSVGAIAGCDNEDELAFVICHEIVHYLHKHSYESYNRRTEIDNFDEDALTDKVLDYFKYSRHNESEADSIGIDLFILAGFDTSHLANAVKNLAPEAMWNQEYNWSPAYLEDAYFKFPEVYKDIEGLDKKKYSTLFDLRSEKKDKKNKEELDSIDVLRKKYATHPDWETRLAAVQNIVSKKTNLPTPSVSASAIDFQRINSTCKWEIIYYYLTRGQYVRAHYYALEMEHEFGPSDDLMFFRTIALNNIYYSYYGKSNSIRFLTPLSDVAGNNKNNIFHFLRFLNVIEKEEWALILARENFKLQQAFPKNAYVQKYLHYAFQELKSKSKGNYKKYIDPLQEDISFLTLDSTNTDEDEKFDTDNLRKSYVTSGLYFLEAENSVSHFDSLYKIGIASSLAKDIEGSFISKSVLPKYNKRQQWLWGNKKDRDTLTMLGTDIQVYTHSQKSYVPDPSKNDRLETLFNNELREAATKLGVELYETSFKDKTVSSAERWNNQYRMTSWLTERAQNTSAAITPIHSLFLNQNTSTASNGLVMFTLCAVYDNGKGYKSAFVPLKPIMDPFRAMFTAGRSKPSVFMLNIIADTKNNTLVLLQIEHFKTNVTDDFIRAQMHHLMFEAKAHINHREK